MSDKPLGPKEFRLRHPRPNFSRTVERLVKSEPTLVYRSGFLHDAMRRERVTIDEVLQAARGQGHADLGAVAAVVLETDGTLGVLSTAPDLPSPDS